MPAAKPRPTQLAETQRRKLRIGLIWWWCVDGVVHRCTDPIHTRSVLSTCWWWCGLCNSHSDPLTRPQAPLAALAAALSALLPAPLPCPACPALAAPYTARTCQLLIPSTQTPGHHWAALVCLPISCRKEGHTPPTPIDQTRPPVHFFFCAARICRPAAGGIGPAQRGEPITRCDPKNGKWTNCQRQCPGWLAQCGESVDLRDQEEI